MMEWVPGTWYELFDASVDRGPPIDVNRGRVFPLVRVPTVLTSTHG